MNSEQLELKLRQLEQSRTMSEVVARVLAQTEVQNWCGEGCRGDCKGGGFFD